MVEEAGVEGLALVGQELLLVGGQQQGVQLLVEAVVPVVAGAVPGVTGDIERLIAARGGRDGLHLKPVRVVGAVSLAGIGLQLLEGGNVLCQCGDGAKDGQDAGEETFHNGFVLWFGLTSVSTSV